MKTCFARAAIGLAMIGLAGPSQALSPAGTSFYIRGPVTITVPGAAITCTLTVKGTTNATVGNPGTLYGGAFTGSTQCATAHLMGTPWSVNNIGTAGSITPMAFTNPLTSTPPVCSAAAVPVTIHANGHWKFINAPVGGCTLNGVLVSHPHITPP